MHSEKDPGGPSEIVVPTRDNLTLSHVQSDSLQPPSSHLIRPVLPPPNYPPSFEQTPHLTTSASTYKPLSLKDNQSPQQQYESTLPFKECNPISSINPTFIPTHNIPQSRTSTFPVGSNPHQPQSSSYTDMRLEAHTIPNPLPNIFTIPSSDNNADHLQSPSKIQQQNFEVQCTNREAVQGAPLPVSSDCNSAVQLPKPCHFMEEQALGLMDLDAQHSPNSIPLQQSVTKGDDLALELQTNDKDYSSMVTQLVSVPIWSYPERPTMQSVGSPTNSTDVTIRSQKTDGKKRTSYRKGGKDNKDAKDQLTEQATRAKLGGLKRRWALRDEAGSDLEDLGELKKLKDGEQLEGTRGQKVEEASLNWPQIHP